MKKNIVVLFGGRSTEHDISIITGMQTLNALDKNKYNVVPIYISREGTWFSGKPLFFIETFKAFEKKKKGVIEVSILPSSKALFQHTKLRLKKLLYIDCAVFCMHGINGEDGTLQGLFELANIPYTSSGVLSSAITIDKVFMKKIFENLRLPILPYFYFNSNNYTFSKVLTRVKKEFDFPVIIKPARLGSSIGIKVCRTEQELEEGINLAKQFDNKIIIETLVENLREINCSVLGYLNECKTSSLEEPINHKNILSFEDKYLNKTGEKTQKNFNFLRILPAKLDKNLEKRIKTMSELIFKEFECKGVIRIDYIIDEDKNELFINEVNTIPGSLSFYLWKEKGTSFEVLLDELILGAIKSHEEKNKFNLLFESNVLEHISGGKSGKKTKL